MGWFALPLLAQNVLSPDEYFGYTLGSRFSSHSQIIDYFQHVAQHSQQVKLMEYGKSYEENPLLLAFISDQENIQNLEELRLSNLSKSGLTESSFASDKIIVWLSYNVHGNEAVSSEAALQTLYLLTNPQKPEIKEWLKKIIVVIDPCLNPDGRERYVNWYKQKKGTLLLPDPDAWEHHEPWPSGRANHYLFDLNRDWVWLTQKETRHRIEVYNQWLPQVHVDFHEQGVNSPYYFPPAAEPFHEIITPWQRDFQRAIGKNHARYFDQHHWLYFTSERFDLLYPSYGDTYPTFNGAIGMTYEQGGSGRAGLAILTETRDTLSLSDRISHHIATGISTIATSFEQADRLLEEYQAYFKNNQENPPLDYKWLVIQSDTSHYKFELLKNFLDMHRVQYQIPGQQVQLKGYDFIKKQITTFEMGSNDLLIPASQPKSSFLKVLFEEKTHLSDSLSYDITAWPLMLAFGLPTFGLEKLNIKIEKGTSPDEVPEEVGKGNTYAYLVQWKDLGGVQLLSKLMTEKIKVRYAQEPFSVQNKKFNRGTLIIAKADNRQIVDFDQRIASLAEPFAVKIQPVNTGLVDQGKDFGSGKVTYIKQPKVGILTGEDVSVYSYGEIWHFFDQNIKYPAIPIDVDYFGQVDWHDYDVFVLPEGKYKQLMADSLVQKLGQWVKKGGRLIAIGSANRIFKDDETWGLKVRNTESGTNAKNKPDSAQLSLQEMKKRLKVYGQRERQQLRKSISGSVFEVSMDNTHPLAFGYVDIYYSLKTSALSFDLLEKGWNVGWIGQQTNPKGGFAGDKAKKMLKYGLVFGTKQIGQGHAVYLIDNPLFRLFWHNGHLLMGNAVFFTGQ